MEQLAGSFVNLRGFVAPPRNFISQSKNILQLVLGRNCLIYTLTDEVAWRSNEPSQIKKMRSSGPDSTFRHLWHG